MERHSAYKTAGTPTYNTVGTTHELAILKLLARYDLLPSSYMRHVLGKHEYTKRTLRDLVKGHYIGLPDMPRDERLAYIPRNSFYVYELKARGRALLAKQGDIYTQGGNDHYKHRLLRSRIEFLLDHGPFTVKGPDAILADERCPESTREAPFPFRIKSPKLEPDITRGFEDDTQTLFVHIEVDRGTEPVISQNARQSLKSKVERYTEYFETKAYETHFGFPGRPSVLFITTRPSTAALIDLFPHKWSKRFYALSIPEKPLPTFDLFVPWQGIDGTLNLKEVLNGQTRVGGESDQALSGDTGEGS